MSPEGWAAIVALIGGLVAIITTQQVQQGTTRRLMLEQQQVQQAKVETVGRKVDQVSEKADHAATAAREARENTKSVSNGFAAATVGGIDDVKSMVIEVRDQQQRLLEISGRTVGRLDQVIARQDRADARFTDHLLTDHLREKG